MILTKLALSLLFFTSLSIATPLSKRGPDDDLAATALANVYKILDGTLSDGSSHGACTKDKLVVRKE